MGRSFNGTTEFLRIASALGLTAPPFTLACVYASNDLAVDQTLMCLCNNGSSDAHYLIFRQSGDVIGAASNDQDIAYGESTNLGGLGAGYNHCAAVWQSDTDRAAVLNATVAASNGANVTPDSVDELDIARYSAGVGSYVNGSLAQLGAWSAALTAAELRSLWGGFPPRRVRPQSLVFAAPLVREVIDIRGAATFATATGSVAAHPRSYGA